MVKAELEAGKRHIAFCVESYKIQLAAKRHFVHEHPEGSTAWQIKEINELMMRPEVGSIVFHGCAFGITSVDSE